MHHTSLSLTLVALLSLAAPASSATTAPAPRAAEVQVGRVSFGVFEQNAQGQHGFRVTSTVPMVAEQSYGWVAEVRTKKDCVKVREELTLPHEPKTWGDPEPGLKQRVSSDGRTATTEVCMKQMHGVISQSWAVAPGDPSGTYVVKVWIEDEAPRIFRFEVR